MPTIVKVIDPGTLVETIPARQPAEVNWQDPEIVMRKGNGAYRRGSMRQIELVFSPMPESAYQEWLALCDGSLQNVVIQGADDIIGQTTTYNNVTLSISGPNRRYRLVYGVRVIVSGVYAP